jgi:hypothetical protein
MELRLKIEIRKIAQFLVDYISIETKCEKGPVSLDKLS